MASTKQILCKRQFYREWHTQNKAVLQSETWNLTGEVHHLFKSKIVGEKNMRLEAMMMKTMMVIFVTNLHLQAAKFLIRQVANTMQYCIKKYII